MTMQRNKTLTLLALTAMIAGCSSSAEKQRHLEMLATSRANLLASALPLKRGPLSIMRASAKGTTIEIIMLYNQDAPSAKPTSQLLKQSIHTYCNSPDTRNNLEVGLSYRLQVRNSRGQLAADELVTYDRCASAEN